nr:hypothetical protein [Tanacetum cinerariifolium]
MNQQCEQEALLAAQREQGLREQKQAAQEKKVPPQNSDFHQLSGEMCGIKVSVEQKPKLEETMLELLEDCLQKEIYCMHNDVEDLIESALNYKLLSINLKSQTIIHKKSSISLKNTPQISSVMAITPDLPTKELEYSLSMGDEHLSTISKTESDEVIKSSVENLVPIPSESEVTFDNESECDVPVCDDFMTFSNSLFNGNDDFTSSDDKSLSNEDIPMENFKFYLNTLFDDEEIIPTKIDPHYFNVESLLNQDTLIDSSPKFDYLLEEFSGEIAHIDPVPPGIEEADFDLEEEIHLVENLLYENSSPRPPEELNAEIADMIVEFLFPSHIPFEDSDSQMEKIDLFLATDDLMPPGIEKDDYDLEGDIYFLKNCLAMIIFPFLKMSHLTLIIMMIRHFLVLFRNHQMLRFSLILSPIRVF